MANDGKTWMGVIESDGLPDLNQLRWFRSDQNASATPSLWRCSGHVQPGSGHAVGPRLAGEVTYPIWPGTALGSLGRRKLKALLMRGRPRIAFEDKRKNGTEGWKAFPN